VLKAFDDRACSFTKNVFIRGGTKSKDRKTSVQLANRVAGVAFGESLKVQGG